MVEEITTDELHDRLAADEQIQVVDIRPAHEFRQGHIPGAVNIPFDRFARDVANYDWGDEIVVVCPLGESSRQAARLLESYEAVDDDARIANLAGGYRDWQYELEKSE